MLLEFELIVEPLLVPKEDDRACVEEGIDSVMVVSPVDMVVLTPGPDSKVVKVDVAIDGNGIEGCKVRVVIPRVIVALVPAPSEVEIRGSVDRDCRTVLEFGASVVETVAVSVQEVEVLGYNVETLIQVKSLVVILVIVFVHTDVHADAHVVAYEPVTEIGEIGLKLAPVVVKVRVTGKVVVKVDQEEGEGATVSVAMVVTVTNTVDLLEVVDTSEVERGRSEKSAGKRVTTYFRNISKRVGRHGIPGRQTVLNRDASGAVFGRGCCSKEQQHE